MVKFKPLNKKDNALVGKIIARADKEEVVSDMTTLTMDLIAVHQNDCLLDFEKLLQADGFNFLHDIYGIGRHIDRQSGMLDNHFLPRCVKQRKSHA